MGEEQEQSRQRTISGLLPLILPAVLVGVASALTMIALSLVATTTREPGTLGAQWRRPARRARLSRPVTRLIRLVSPREVKRSQSFAKKLPSPFSTPKSLGS